MLKNLTISAAMSALMVSGALAQASPPAASPPKADAPKVEMAPGDAGKFLSSQSADQWVFSKFKGTDVIGPDSAQVGDVNDVLFDKNGKVIALIVGVGGFLGLGEKSVAIDMAAFQVAPADSGAAGGAGGASNDPTNVKLKVSWTKEQLKSAPDFQYFKAPTSTTGTSPTTGMAPRPTPQR